MYDLSIIVPVYNGSAYLKGCVECLRNQGLENYEIILVNDGSLDDSLEQAYQLSEKYANIKVLTKNNTGLSETRNYGFYHAEGKYVYFLDVDDFLVKNTLVRLLEKAEEKKADIVAFNSLNISDDILYVNEVCEIPEEKKYDSAYQKRYIAEKGIYNGKEFVVESLKSISGFFPPVWLMMYKREFMLEKNLKFIPIIHEDLAFSIEACLKADRIACVNEILHLRRIVPNSITNGKKTEKHVDGVMYAVQHATQIYKKYASNKEEKIQFRKWGRSIGWQIYTELITCEKKIQKKYKYKCIKMLLKNRQSSNLTMIIKFLLM